MKLQAFEASNRKSLQSQMLPRPENRPLLNRFGGSSRPTDSIRSGVGAASGTWKATIFC
jgi:hypothetical protein